MSEQYYVLHQDQQQGPFSIEEIRRKVQDREFTEANLVWHEGLTDWKPISDLIPSEAFQSPLIPPDLDAVAPSPHVQATPPPLPTKSAWYDSNLAIFGSIPLSLFCICLPIGIIPLWLTKRFDRNAKIALTLVFSLPFLCIMLIGLFGPKPSGKNYSSRPSVSANRDKAPTAPPDPSGKLEKLVRKHLSSKDFEYIKVEKIGLNQDKYFLNVSYRSRHASIGGENGSFRLIKIDMNNLYRAIVSDPELAVAHIKINAQLDMQDKYGNTAWIDVYRTQVTEDTIGKLNKDNLRSVNFEAVWDVAYIHSIFWPYK